MMPFSWLSERRTFGPVYQLENKNKIALVELTKGDCMFNDVSLKTACRHRVEDQSNCRLERGAKTVDSVLVYLTSQAVYGRFARCHLSGDSQSNSGDRSAYQYTTMQCVPYGKGS